MLKKIKFIMLAVAMTIFASSAAQAQGENKMIKFETSMGDFVVKLNEEKAPITSANFLRYVNEGFYDGTIFHRVISNFMIQGGGFSQEMKQKDNHGSIENEADNGLKNNKYTIAMARTQEPHSASSQFFINTKNNSFLDFSSPTPQGWGYAVFGEVVEGMDVIDKIEGVQTTTHGFHSDVPVEQVIINKASVVE